MPSMSYCVFENTSGDLGRCLDKMEQFCFGHGEMDMNEYELRAFHRMYTQCKDFIQMYEQFEGALVE